MKQLAVGIVVLILIFGAAILALMSGFIVNVDGKDYMVVLENGTPTITEQKAQEQGTPPGNEGTENEQGQQTQTPASNGQGGGTGGQTSPQQPSQQTPPEQETPPVTEQPPAETPPAQETPLQTEPVCGNGMLETGEECDVGSLSSPASNKCPSGEYCSGCKCYTPAEPISCKANHDYVQKTGINNFIYTTLPVCGDDCNDVFGVDYKCDLTTCTCIPKSVTSHTCGNNIKETIEECDGYDDQWCKSDEICGAACTCVSGTRGVCGDNVRQVNEQCDGTDKALCKAGATCSGTCRCVAAVQAVCGNNKREGNEQCDGTDKAACAANQVCSPTCMCQQQQNVVASVCGNSIREGNEQCDGTDRGYCGSTQVCNSNCLCQETTTQAVCGNNKREGAEECDGSDRSLCGSTQTCNNYCFCQDVTPQSVCGNNVRETTEQCDGSDKGVCTAGQVCSNCMCVCVDSDADGVCDTIDNCPNHYDPGQGDHDADGIGDVCDLVPVDCAFECGDLGLTSYGPGENNKAACDLKIQQDVQNALNGLTSRECFTTCKYAQTDSSYYSISLNTVTYGCCCLGTVKACKTEHACANCPGQNPVCPNADTVCKKDYVCP